MGRTCIMIATLALTLTGATGCAQIGFVPRPAPLDRLTSQPAPSDDAAPEHGASHGARTASKNAF